MQYTVIYRKGYAILMIQIASSQFFWENNLMSKVYHNVLMTHNKYISIWNVLLKMFWFFLLTSIYATKNKLLFKKQCKNMYMYLIYCMLCNSKNIIHMVIIIIVIANKQSVCSRPMTFNQRGIPIEPHLLLHLTSIILSHPKASL